MSLSRWIPLHISALKIQRPVTQLLNVLTCLGMSNVVMLVQPKARLMNTWHLHGISCFQTGVITWSPTANFAVLTQAKEMDNANTKTPEKGEVQPRGV